MHVCRIAKLAYSGSIYRQISVRMYSMYLSRPRRLYIRLHAFLQLRDGIFDLFRLLGEGVEGRAACFRTGPGGDVAAVLVLCVPCLHCTLALSGTYIYIIYMYGR